MNKPVFHLKLLKNYQIVNVPGTYQVSVAYTVTEDSLIDDDHPRYLIPLRVVTAQSLKDLLEEVPDDKKVVNFEDVKQHFLMGAIWEDDVVEEELPVKGERVLASFDYVDGVMRCIHIELIPRETLPFIDIDDLIKFRSTILKMIKQ